MRNTNFYEAILILMILTGIVTLSFADVMNEVVVYNTGKIILEITAQSGYWQDIQAAVNLAATSGVGIVHIPEGTWNFVNDGESWYGARVTIPAGVNVSGAPTERYPNGSVVEWKTVLVMPWDMPGDNGYIPPHWFLIQGNRDTSKSSRFSDIKLVGYRDSNSSAIGFCLGIRVEGVVNFRIDHCCTKEINDGIQVGTGYGADPACGVIDHCSLLNDYGFPDPYGDRTTGYGVCIYRSESTTEWEDITNLLGKYTDHTVFIEDCYFTKWRHCVVGNNGAHYVFRHNIVEHGFGYGEVDTHPLWTSPYVSCRAMEAYDNQFLDLDPWGGAIIAFSLKSAGGCIFNNVAETGYDYFAWMGGDGSGGWNSAFDPHDFYVWNNTYPSSYVTGGATENEDYFLYKPNWYTPYPYPHPLTSP